MSLQLAHPILSATLNTALVATLLFIFGATSSAQEPKLPAKGEGKSKVESKAKESSPPAAEMKQEEKAPSDSGAIVLDKGEQTAADVEKAKARMERWKTLIVGLTIFVLAIFVGFEVIAKVPPTLHTPLMSGSNAISGITIVGSIIIAGHGWSFPSFVGMIAVALAAINVVGGFLVTHRMLSMFKRR